MNACGVCSIVFWFSLTQKSNLSPDGMLNRSAERAKVDWPMVIRLTIDTTWIDFCRLNEILVDQGSKNA